MTHAKNFAELTDPTVTEANPIEVRILNGHFKVRTVRMHTSVSQGQTDEFIFDDTWGEPRYYDRYEHPFIQNHLILSEIDSEYSSPIVVLWDEAAPDFQVIRQIVADLHRARPMSDTANAITYENRMEVAMHLYSEIFVAAYCIEAKNFHVDAAIAAIDAYTGDQANRFDNLMNRVNASMQSLGIKGIKFV